MLIWLQSPTIFWLGVGKICLSFLNVHRVNDYCMYSLGISPASDCGLPTFQNPLSVPSSRAGCRV